MTGSVDESRLVLCERLDARILPGFCARYRVDKITCRNCAQAEEMDRLAQGLPALAPTRTRGGSPQGKPNKKEQVEMSRKPIRQCVECGEVRPILGGGKCSSCYNKERRAKRNGDANSSPPAVNDHDLPADQKSQGAAADADSAINTLADAWGCTDPKKKTAAIPVERLSCEEAMRPKGSTCTPCACEEIPAQQPPTDIPAAITVMFEDARDRGLLKALQDAARLERRTPGAQMLIYLERALEFEE